jgi:uncharacterized repeat protein (TIGR02543 family)
LLAVLAALAFFFTGCSDTGGEDPTPTVTGVTVSPETPTLTLNTESGKTLQFTATVTGAYNPSQSVVWRVDGNQDKDTKFSNASDGLLFVAPGETAASLIVRAVSAAKTTEYGVAIVTIKSAGETAEDGATSGGSSGGTSSGGGPVSAGVTVTPATETIVTSLTDHLTKQFTASIGNGNVTWQILGNPADGTTILNTAGSEGKLTVSQNETAPVLIIAAISKTNPAIYGTAKVTIVGDRPPGWPSLYTVTFHDDSGQSPPQQSIFPDGRQKAVEPIVTRSHYTLDGWFTNPTSTTPYNFNTPVTGNLTLYAKWTPRRYNITYVLDGGTNPLSPPSDYDIETPVTLPIPTKANHIFGGWYTSDQFRGFPETAIDPTVQNFNGEHKTFYAKWIPVGSPGIAYYWVDELDNLSLSVNTFTLAAGGSLTIVPNGGGYTGHTWYVNGVDTQATGGTYTFSSAGRDPSARYTIGLQVQKNSRYYYTEISIQLQ